MTQEFTFFTLNAAVFALDVRRVREVIRVAALSPAVGSDQLEGLLNLRGDVIPVVDIRHLLSLSPQPVQVTDFLIILEVDQRRFALRTEGTARLEAVSESAVQMSDATAFISGTIQIEEQIASLLDPKKLCQACDGCFDVKSIEAPPDSDA